MSRIPARWALPPLFLLVTAPPAAAQVTLTLGEWVVGALEPADPVDAEGFVYDAFALPEGFEGLVAVTVESADFDAYLEWGVMGGGEFVLVSKNDDFPGLTSATDARTYVQVGPGERPHLRVFSLDGGPDGAYRVHVAPVEIFGAPPQSVSYGDEISGLLEEGDDFGEGAFIDRFRFAGAAGDRVEVVLEADFDAYLVVSPVGGAPLAEDDDGFGGTDAYLEVELPQTGEYEVRVTSFLPALGEYRLRLGPDLGVEPAPDFDAESARMTDEERAGLEYDGERVWNEMMGFDLPSPGADFTLMDPAMVEEMMGGGAPNLHMWMFQDVLETAQFMIMAIKTGGVADVATMELMNTLLVESSATSVLEQESDWEGSRSIFTRFRANDGSEAELRCVASPPERTSGLIVCLLGSSTDGWSFKETMAGLEVR